MERRVRVQCLQRLREDGRSKGRPASDRQSPPQDSRAGDGTGFCKAGIRSFYFILLILEVCLCGVLLLISHRYTPDSRYIGRFAFRRVYRTFPNYETEAMLLQGLYFGLL